MRGKTKSIRLPPSLKLWRTGRSRLQRAVGRKGGEDVKRGRDLLTAKYAIYANGEKAEEAVSPGFQFYAFFVFFAVKFPVRVFRVFRG